MRRALLFVGLGLTLLSTQKSIAQSTAGGRAYPMNVEDRIAIVGERGRGRLGGDPNTTVTIVSDDDDDIGRAGAFPMNTLDRIKMAERQATRSATSGRQAHSTPSRPVAVAKPDAWRYQWFENRWWYYAPGNQWYYRTANRWQIFNGPTTAPTTGGQP